MTKVAESQGMAQVFDTSTLGGKFIVAGAGLLFAGIVVPFIYKTYIFDRDTSMIPKHMKGMLALNLAGSFAISKFGEGIVQKSWADSIDRNKTPKDYEGETCGNMKLAQGFCNTQKWTSVFGDFAVFGGAFVAGLYLTDYAQKYGKFPNYGDYYKQAQFLVPSLIFSIKRMISDHMTKCGVNAEFATTKTFK
ncbi:MAG: hypothetical protein JSR80_03970 [Verrucomicrobia bacterium]|nr:hypothetical protein [Verrucomicrobiota bacterium]